MSAPGDTTLLYAGNVNGIYTGDLAQELYAHDSSVRILNNTDACNFIDIGSDGPNNNPRMQDALVRIFRLESIEDLYVDVDEGTQTEVNKFLYGENISGEPDRINNGAWDIISENFAQGAQGQVRTLTAYSRDSGVFAMTELEALLDNPGVTEIDGIPKEQLLSLRNAESIETVRDLLFDNSFFQVHASGLSAGNQIKGSE